MTRSNQQKVPSGRLSNISKTVANNPPIIENESNKDNKDNKENKDSHRQNHGNKVRSNHSNHDNEKEIKESAKIEISK